MTGTPRRLIGGASRKLKSGKSIRTSASGRSASRRRDQPAARRKRSRQLGDRLRQPGDRDVAVIVHERAAGRRELRPAEAGDANGGIEGQQLARQRAGIEIAGRLAAREQEAGAQEAGRLNSAASIGVLIFTSMTRRSTDSGADLLRRAERDLDAVDRPIVGKLLFDDRPSRRVGGVHTLADQPDVGIDVEHDRVEIARRQLERVIHDALPDP